MIELTASRGRVRNVIVVDDSADNFGGTAQVAYVTARVLADRGYNVVYFAGSGPVHSRLDGIRVICAHELPALQNQSKVRGAIQGLWSRKTYRTMLSLLAEFDSEDTVVHVHSWTHTLSSSVFSAIAKAGFPTLFTLHDYFLTCPNGGFYDYQTNEICYLRPCSVACACRNCDKRSYFQKLYRLLRISIQTHQIAKVKRKRLCYLSPFTYRILKGNRFDDGHPAYLPNPISVEPGSDSLSPSERVGYLYVGRFDSEKNPELFCRALTRAGLPGTLCGDGPQLARLRDEYPNLEFLGWCDKSVLARQYRSRRTLVLTSSCFETSSLVCLEAMLASGIPPIVPETCGATAYIEDCVNGLYFKNNDEDSLCAALARMEDDDFYEKLCMNVARELPTLFDDHSYETYATRVIARYEGLYE